MISTRFGMITRIFWIFVLTVFLTVPQFRVAEAAPGVGLAQHYANLATPDTSKWRNGAIGTGEADYAETEVLPHYLSFIDLTAGVTYGFTIEFDYYQSSKQACGFLNLDTYDATTRLKPIYIPVGWSDPDTTTPRTDTNMSPINNPGGTLYSFNTSTVTILPGPTTVPATNPPIGDVMRYVQVTFVPTADGTVEFYYGLLLSADDGCFPGNDFNGIADWSGASLQTGIAPTPVISGATMLGPGGTLSLNPGLFVQEAAINGIKFFDVDGDGLYEPSALPPAGPDYPLGGWTIRLYDCDSDNTCTTTRILDRSYVTNPDGSYVFTDGTLMDDQDYYQVCEVMSTSSTKWEPTVLDIPDSTGNPIQIVSDEACFTPFQYLVTGNSIVRDFGNWLGPTAVTLTNFNALLQNQVVLVNWQTGIAAETLGFNLYRSLLEDGSDKALLANLDVDFDNFYEYTDNNVTPGEVYYYWLEALYLNGSSELFGPYAAGYLNRVFLPVSLNKPQSIYPYSGE